MKRTKWLAYITWTLIAILGSCAFGILALSRGERINSFWLLTAAICSYFIAYRFYSRFLAKQVLEFDDNRQTPAHEYQDGKDFVPTNKWVLFGHHFAAIAGAGPLVGPILAAQMGFLPGTLWIIVGVILGGAVQDLIILFASMRRKGKSLGEMAREEISPISGLMAMIGILSIMIILIAVLGLVVVKALIGSPWGMFTLIMTLPIALLMGIFMRLFPSQILTASLLGFFLLIASILVGQIIADHPFWGPFFTFDAKTIVWMMIIYGFAASALPVWLLLAPRDYLSTFLKIGTILALAISILIVMPDLAMPPITSFIDGTGPVFTGNLFPFLFITIACGSISGFHALIASGTTPKMISRESHARIIGYGGMITESFVAIMAMIAACILTPGVYFAINSPPSVIGLDVESAARTITSFGFTITPDELIHVADQIKEESILSRTGGAPTLAIGIAKISSSVFGGKAWMAFWYHFAILFEAVFILTAIDAGTRVGRFIIQDFLGQFMPKLGKTEWLPANLLASALVVAGWGYFLYQGATDPLGGINSLWPLFGIANQMLAVIALTVGTTILLKMGKRVYIWVTGLPLIWLVGVTFTAGWSKIFDPNPAHGFLAAAHQYQTALHQGFLIHTAQTVEEMKQIIFNHFLDAVVTAFFLILISIILMDAFRNWYKLIMNPELLPIGEVPHPPHSSTKGVEG